MLLQLSPPLELMTPKGKGLCWLVIDYGLEHDLLFTVVIDDTGEIWTYNNKDVRATKNITAGRTLTKHIDIIHGGIKNAQEKSYGGCHAPSS